MKAIRGRVLVKMDTTQKERYNLGNGATLYIERGYNFNRREDYPSLATVIDGDGLPEGAEVLLHHNVSEKTYAVDGEQVLTDEERLAGYKILSVPEDMCFCYRVDGGDWVPYKSFLLTTRIFKPYEGSLVGIDAEVVKNRMLILKGVVYDEADKPDERQPVDISGKVCITTENCDYEIIFHNKENREERIIRTRNREILGIDHGMTEKVLNGELLIGLNPTQAEKHEHSRRKNKIARSGVGAV